MKKNDFILLSAAILISAAIIVCFFAFLGNRSADTVVITVNGEKLAEFPLDEDIEYWINGSQGEKNLLIIKDGAAYITEANCPDKVCVHSGRAEELKPITCLPNKVVVTISER